MYSAGKMKYERKYVGVTARFAEDGALRPLLIEFDRERSYPIDKILDVSRVACERAGGIGDRYTCLIQGQEAYLWFDRGRWYVAAKVLEQAKTPPDDLPA